MLSLIPDCTLVHEDVIFFFSPADRAAGTLLFSQTFSSLFWGGLCFAYLRYLECSETMARLYPRADRKVSGWVVLLLFFVQMHGIVYLWEIIHP